MGHAGGRLPSGGLPRGQVGAGDRPVGGGQNGPLREAAEASLQQPSPAVASDFVRLANDVLRAQANSLEFAVSPDPRKLAVRLIDRESGAVIREYEVGRSHVFDEVVGRLVPGQLLHAVA
ncbi:Uncharacterized protein ToN1_33890 [Aromatoleum petrolei]|nr:Uncharacterized protein ToN1_33890 [Aromatoleum petrolei]